MKDAIDRSGSERGINNQWCHVKTLDRHFWSFLLTFLLFYNIWNFYNIQTFPIVLTLGLVYHYKFCQHQCVNNQHSSFFITSYNFLISFFLWKNDLETALWLGRLFYVWKPLHFVKWRSIMTMIISTSKFFGLTVIMVFIYGSNLLTRVKDECWFLSCLSLSKRLMKFRNVSGNFVKAKSTKSWL